jgi:hypothetical protein
MAQEQAEEDAQVRKGLLVVHTCATSTQQHVLPNVHDMAWSKLSVIMNLSRCSAHN